MESQIALLLDGLTQHQEFLLDDIRDAWSPKELHDAGFGPGFEAGSLPKRHE